MTRTTTLLLTVVLVIGGVSAFPMAATAQSSPSDATALDAATYAQVNENASENASDIAPGERLSAVVGLGQAEFEGEVELRAYGLEFASAATADAKADVVADRLDRIQERLDELERERQDLEAARENGEISEGEYRARATELAARGETVKQLADASEARAGSLPAELLEEKGINVTAIQTLRQDAENLTGPEVAAIARSIGGDDVGRSVSQGPPSEIGVPSPDERPGGDRGGADGTDTRDRDRDEREGTVAIDRAASELETAESRLEQAEARLGENASENASAALEQAREELEQARQALADAQAAAEAGDDAAAESRAEAALEHAELAVEHVQEALDAAGDGTATDDGSGDGASGTGDEAGSDADGTDY